MFTIWYPEIFFFSLLLLALPLNHHVKLGTLHKSSVFVYLCKMGDNGYLSCKVIEGLKERMQEKNMVHHKCNNWLIHLLMTNAHTHIGLGTRYRDHAMDPPDLLPICNTRAYLKKWNTRMRAFTNDIYKNIFIVTLFVMVTNWKLPNVHQQWMDK